MEMWLGCFGRMQLIKHININKLTVIYIQIIRQAKVELCRGFLQCLAFTVNSFEDFSS